MKKSIKKNNLLKNHHLLFQKLITRLTGANRRIINRALFKVNMNMHQTQKFQVKTKMKPQEKLIQKNFRL